jgi:hypothetical protein
MPNRYAVASSNWSSLATWNGGLTLPTASDVVFTNGFNETILVMIFYGRRFYKLVIHV